MDIEAVRGALLRTGLLDCLVTCLHSALKCSACVIRSLKLILLIKMTPSNFLPPGEAEEAARKAR